MKRALVAAFAVWLSSLGLVAQSPTPAARQQAIDQPASPTQIIKQYCIGCHSERGKAGGLSLADFDVVRSTERPEVSEKIIRKLQAGMMPPAGARRPGDDTLLTLRRAIETQMDRWAAANPNPGW